MVGGVILVFLGTAITAGALVYVMHTHRSTRTHRSWVNALHVAEAGVEVAINEFYKEVSGVPPWIGWSNVTANPRIKAFVNKPLLPTGVVSETNRFYSVIANLDTFTVTSTGTVTLAQFTNGMQRTLQVKLQPDYTSPFSAALLAKSYVKHGGNASVDSFDSSGPNKSTNGQYDPLKRQVNGDIVTVSSDPEAAIFATGSGVLYGDLIAGIGGGVKISGNYTNLGAVGSGADTDISDVIVPMSTVLTHPSLKMSGAAVETIVVAGNMDRAIGYIKATGGAITITGSGRLRLYVEGETSISGTATMHITPSPAGAPLAVEIYANGDVLLNSCVNQTGNAANLGIFGTKNCKVVKYTGASHFTGFMYVPYAAYDFSGQGDFLGAVVSGTIDVTGTGDFHYDEALTKKSMPFLLGYRILNWEEI